MKVSVIRRLPSIISLVPPPNLQLGSSGSPAKIFHGVGIGPLSKILAVKCAATVSSKKWLFDLGFMWQEMMISDKNCVEWRNPCHFL